MKAVTMVTPNYTEEFFHFYNSFKQYNKINIICYLINFSKSQEEYFKQYFQDIEFKTYNGNFNHERRRRPKVTHLKGQFLQEVKEENKDHVLWIDSSKIYQINFKFIEEKLSNSDHILVTRPNRQDPKEYFSAGFFAFNKDSPNLNIYKKTCQKEKTDWFADQMAFADLEKDIELNYYDYYTENYDPNAFIIRNFQTDKLSKQEATKKHFREIMSNKISNYYEKIQEFYKNIPKKILAFLHDPQENWCYRNTIEKIKKYSKHDIEICERTNDPGYLAQFNPDLVWSRGGVFHMDDFFKHRPDLKKKTIASITTSGDKLYPRITRSLSYGQQIKGFIVQNEESRIRLKQYLNKPIYLCPNGMEEFNQREEPETFTVGFIGRNKDENDINHKGYRMVKEACNYLGVPLIEANNHKNFIENDQIPEFLKKVSVLVLPSYAEGCSNTLMESMANETPIITTKQGYHGENCQDQKDIVFCSRSVYDIAQKIQKLKENPKQRKKIAHNGLKFAQKHDIRTIAKIYDEVFDKETK